MADLRPVSEAGHKVIQQRVFGVLEVKRKYRSWDLLTARDGHRARPRRALSPARSAERVALPGCRLILSRCLRPLPLSPPRLSLISSC